MIIIGHTLLRMLRIIINYHYFISYVLCKNGKLPGIATVTKEGGVLKLSAVERADHNGDHVITNYNQNSIRQTVSSPPPPDQHKPGPTQPYLSFLFSLTLMSLNSLSMQTHTHTNTPLPPPVPPPVKKAISPSICVCEGLSWCVSNDNVPVFLSAN